jgi:hypothetical protein
MKIDFKQIINIKNKDELKKFNINEPIFFNNYLFHYLIIFNKLDILKLDSFPIYKENDEDMNGFFLAAKYDNMDILRYLIDKYPDYIYNKNSKNEIFINYLKPEKIVQLLNYKLEWNRLFLQKISDNIFFFDIVLSDCNYDDLNNILKIFKPKNHPLNALIVNQNLTSENIIYLLKLFDKSIYNLRDDEDTNLLFPAISRNDKKIINFLLENNIESNYFTMINTISPLMFTYLNNNLKITKIIWDHIKNIFDYEALCRYLENIAHFILKNQYFDDLSLEILSNCNSYVWHQHNINKVTPLHLLTKLDFNNFNKIINNQEINLNIKGPDNKTLKESLGENNEWIKYLSTKKEYKKINDVIMEIYPYTHANLFQAKFKDISMIILNIKNKYGNLYLPNIDDVSIKNLNSSEGINLNWPDFIFEISPIFPWIICYETEDRYWIHQNLNNLINSSRRDKIHDYALVYLSLNVNDIGLHANILIYDYNRMTIERFDPYGDTVYFDKYIDDNLEEELTWNTGFKYLKPSDYMPVSGFQTISDELNPLKQKSGDFGGFCLAWCTWYLEHRIKNSKINQKDLVKKLIKKMSIMNISFMEYIRNYANNLNYERVENLINAGFDEKEISNTVINNKTNNKLNTYLINIFSKNKID